MMKSKKEYSHLLESEYVKRWVGKYRNPQSYLSVLADYCTWLGKSPDEIIKEHHKDITQNSPLDIDNIARKQINDYFKYLIEHGISNNSARQYCYSKLPAFFRANNIPLRFDIGEVPPEEDRDSEKLWRDENGIIAREDKREILKKVKSLLSVRDQTILLCKISSSIDDVDLFSKKIKEFRNGYLQNLNISYIYGNRIKVTKTQAKYQTFFSAEACDMVNFYLKERERLGEKITDNSWLFTSDKNMGKKIKATAFSANLKYVCDRLGIEGLTPKSLRRWFKSQCTRNNIDDGVRKRLMGHKGGISRYYEEMFADIQEFAEYYVENIEPIICITNGTSKRMNIFEKEIQDLKTENNELNDKILELYQYLGLRDGKEFFKNFSADLKAKKESEKKEYELLDDLK